MLLRETPADSAASTPLWKWLLNPKARLQLHENRRVPGPGHNQKKLSFSAAAASQNSSSASAPNPNNREVALWRWRLKMQSIMATGTPVASSSSSAAAAAHPDRANLQGKDSYLFGVERNQHPAGINSTAGARKPDARFCAKTCSPNLMSEIQNRTMLLMSLNLTPVSRSALAGSRFEMLPELRAQAYESLRRCVGKLDYSKSNLRSSVSTTKELHSLAFELHQWKMCVGSMLVGDAAAAATAAGSDGTNNVNSGPVVVSSSAVVVVPHAAFVELGARVAQLCCLEDTPDEAGADKSRKEFAQLAERDWVSQQAQGRCSHRSSIMMNSSNQSTRGAGTTTTSGPLASSSSSAPPEPYIGMPILHWVNGVLLPVALILAPEGASSTEETLVAHAVEFFAQLRGILFPQHDPAVHGKWRPPSGSHRSSSAQHYHHHQPHHHASDASDAAVVVVGGADNRPIHYHAKYEQRLVTHGFYEGTPPVSSTSCQLQQHQQQKNSSSSSNSNEKVNSQKLDVGPAGFRASSASVYSSSTAAALHPTATMTTTSNSTSRVAHLRQQQQSARLRSPVKQVMTYVDLSAVPKRTPQCVEKLIARRQQQQEQQQNGSSSPSQQLTGAAGRTVSPVPLLPASDAALNNNNVRKTTSLPPVASSSSQREESMMMSRRGPSAAFHRHNSAAVRRGSEEKAPLHLVFMDFSRAPNKPAALEASMFSGDLAINSNLTTMSPSRARPASQHRTVRSAIPRELETRPLLPPQTGV